MLNIGSIVYAGNSTGSSGNVYKSTDNGQNWTSTATIGKPIYALGANSTYIFAGTSNDGMRRTNNGGTTWTTINSGLPTTGEKSIRAIAVNGSKIYIGTGGRGVFRSTNDGTNWVAANGGIGSVGYTFIRSVAVKGDTIFAGVNGGVIRSFNNGTSWENVFSNSGLSTVYALLLNGQTLYAGGGPGLNSDGGIYVSNDWGQSWSSLNTTFPSIPEVWSLHIANNKLYAGTYGLSVWSYDLPPATKTLNLTSVLLEGLYNGAGKMLQASDENGAHWPAGVADHITVELHDAANYATIVYTVDVALSTTGTASVTIPADKSGSYYITIKHRNSIETTTAIAKSFAGSTIAQSFGTTADVFGGNLQLMIGGGHAIYGGDVNQDGIIDSGDMIPVENDAASASSGYLFDDCNGDGLIDSSDMVIIENNAALAIGAATP